MLQHMQKVLMCLETSIGLLRMSRQGQIIFTIYSHWLIDLRDHGSEKRPGAYIFKFDATYWEKIYNMR